MYEYYFTFGSLTAAQAAVKALHRFAVPCRQLRTPKPLQLQGCGHSVVVGSGYYIQSKDEFDRLRLPYHHVFCRMPDGSFEEVEL